MNFGVFAEVSALPQSSFDADQRTALLYGQPIGPVASGANTPQEEPQTILQFLHTRRVGARHLDG
jgi:hypothetical protein